MSLHKITLALCAAGSILLAAAAGAEKNGERERGKGEARGRQEQAQTPELAAFKQQLESLPSDRIKQMIAVERTALEQWCNKHNFDPPGRDGPDDRGKGTKGRDRKGKAGKSKVKLSERREAELMAQYRPWKAKIDAMEEVLRERDRPKKEDRPKKDK